MSLYQPWLTTLQHVKLHRDLDAEEAKDDDFLQSLIVGASQEIIGALDRIPLPYVPEGGQMNYDALGRHVSFRTLNVKDLLAITSLTNGDGTAITSDQYVLESANVYPKWRVRLKSGAGVSFTYSESWEQALTLVGLFGYMPHYPSAFTDTSVDGTLDSAAATSLAVGSSGKLFEVGQYLRLENEYLRVTAINTGSSPDTLTVVRGELGTTAAEHDSVDVETFAPSEDIREAVREIVAYRFKKRDVMGGRVRVFDGGSVVVEDLDPSVQTTIDRHRYGKFMIGVV